MYKCPNCDYTSEVAGTCPTHNIALVEQPKTEETATETPAAAKEKPAENQ